MSIFDEVMSKKMEVYAISVEHNPAFKSDEDEIEVDTIYVQKEKVEIAIRRFLFIKKRKERLIKETVELKVKDLPIGTVVCVLEEKCPDRWLAIDNKFCLMKNNDKRELELL